MWKLVDLDRYLRQALDTIEQLRGTLGVPGVLSQQWTFFTGGAHTITVGSQKIAAAPTAPIALSFPVGSPAPPDQSIIIIKDVIGQSQIDPITLSIANLPAGWTIENPAQPGTFVSGATPATMTAQGNTWWFQANVATKQLIEIV